MITCIREIRKAKGLTLEDVAGRCKPPTTAQTIGRLETGTRTVSVGWLNRIADALGVQSADLVRMPEQKTIPVAALLGQKGAHAPAKTIASVPPLPSPGIIAVRVTGGVGDYRSGDEIWCERVMPDAFAGAINRDVLVPRPSGRFLFGRLIAHEDRKLHLLPLGAGIRQQVIADPAWIGVAVKLLRPL